MKNSFAFYLHKREVTRGSYWYVYYLDPNTGKQRTAISINTLRKKLRIYDRTPINRRREAEYIAQKALDEGLITFGKQDPIFIQDSSSIDHYLGEIGIYLPRTLLIGIG